MTVKAKHETFSYRINFFIKLILIIFYIMVINAESYFVAGFAVVGLLTLLLKAKLRNSWLKLVSKIAYVLIAYVVLDLIFTADIESSLALIGKLLCYLLLLIWLKETTSFNSYLSDVYSTIFVFGVNLISRKLDSFFHYFNFYLIATSKLVSKFIQSYEEQFAQRSSFMNFFMQVFFTTMMRIPETKVEINEKMAVINYRPFDWKANLPIIGLIILLGFLYWSNCEQLCRNFFLK